MNFPHTDLYRFFRRVCRYRKLAGLFIRRPGYRLLCGDCVFCMGACGRAVKNQSQENGSGALSRQRKAPSLKNSPDK